MKKYLTAFLLCLAISSCSDSSKLQPLTYDATILAYGDSLTYGSGVSRDQAYPAVLESLTGLNVINAGVPGETSKQGLTRLRAAIQQHQPELVILCHGGNDFLGKLDPAITRNNIQQMIDIARDHQAQVILISVPEPGLFLRPSPIYKHLAALNKVPVENDIVPDILASNALKSDHVHPNSKGYQLLAEKIAALLRNTGALSID
jgi:lysophospholipase L1-like esterase